MSKWERVKLSSVVQTTMTGEWGTECVNENSCTKVLRTTNFTNTGMIDYQNVVLRSIPEKKRIEKRLINQDIILEKSGGSDTQPVGRVVFFCNDSDEVYLCNNFTQILRINKSKAYPKFIFYYLYYLHMTGATEALQNKTTGIRNLQIKRYMALELNLPSLSLQKNIVCMLDLISSFMDMRKTQIEKLDLLVKSRFVEMFGDGDNSAFPVKPMTDVCTVIDGDRGKNYPKQEDFSTSGYCLFLNAKNVTSKGFSFDDCMFISEEKDELLRKGKLERGDVILTTRGTIGNLAHYNENVPYENVRINSGMVILRMKSKIINETFFIEQFRMRLERIKQEVASGSAQPQLPISTMHKIGILVPPIVLQKKYEAFVRKTDKSKLAIQKSLIELETLKKALMQQYFG